MIKKFFEEAKLEELEGVLSKKDYLRIMKKKEYMRKCNKLERIENIVTVILTLELIALVIREETTSLRYIYITIAPLVLMAFYGQSIIEMKKSHSACKKLNELGIRLKRIKREEFKKKVAESDYEEYQKIVKDSEDHIMEYGTDLIISDSLNVFQRRKIIKLIKEAKG